MEIKLLEGLLFSLLALGFGFWQLHDVNKALKKTKKEKEAAELERKSDASDTTS